MKNVKNIISANKRRATHGMYNTKVYHAWQSMRQRCSNPKNTRYHRYGGRGISVCPQWQKFAVFYKDMGAPPTGKHSIDRVDNNGNYEPSNCRWATSRIQSNNTKQNTNITYQGKTQSIADWARETGLAYHIIKYRASIGWGPTQIFSTDSFKGKTTMYTIGGLTVKAYAAREGIPLSTAYYKLGRL